MRALILPSALAVLAVLLLGPESAAAQAVPDTTFSMPPQFDMTLGGGGEDGLHISGAVGIVLMMGVLTMLPSMVLLMTCFTRIIIVLHLLRQALGTATAPPTMLLGALALLITGFVMMPTLEQVHADALQPYLDGQMTQEAALTAGVEPFREFMLRHTREEDLGLFLEMSGRDPEAASAGSPAIAAGEGDIPLLVLMSAYVTSELRTAFFLGFIIFLPFLIIDLIVASVLLGLGVFMLPPVMISLPFKLLLFVLADGWFLLVSSLVQGFHP